MTHYLLAVHGPAEMDEYQRAAPASADAVQHLAERLLLRATISQPHVDHDSVVFRPARPMTKWLSFVDFGGNIALLISYPTPRPLRPSDLCGRR